MNVSALPASSALKVVFEGVGTRTVAVVQPTPRETFRDAPTSHVMKRKC
jgi:hypothetical protein